MVLRSVFLSSIIVLYVLKVMASSDFTSHMGASTAKYISSGKAMSTLVTAILCSEGNSVTQETCLLKHTDVQAIGESLSMVKSSERLCQKNNVVLSSQARACRDDGAFYTLRQERISQSQFDLSSSKLSINDSLAYPLVKLILKYLKICDLIILHSTEYKDSMTVDELLRLPNLKQVVDVGILEDPLQEILWKSMRCQGIIFLLSDLPFLLELGEHIPLAWDYSAKVIVAGFSKEQLELFIQTRKGRKTEHIIGLVQANEENHFDVYMNELYWGTRKLKHISTWRQDSFTKIEDLNPFPEKTRDLRGTVLNVVSFEVPPCIIYHRDQDGNIIFRYGYDVEIGRALADAFNFTIFYLESPQEQNFGYRLPNGSFSGMVGYLAAGQGDLAVSNIWVGNADGRLDVYDISAHYDIDNLCVHIAVDPPLPLWQSPSFPFQMITWIVVFIGLLFSGPILYAFVEASNEIEPGHNDERTFWTLMLYTYGVHFSQSMTNLPRNSSTKVFVTFLWVYSIILTTGYKSNLMAFLTTPKEANSIETIKELYESGLRIIGFPYFKTSLEFSTILYPRLLAKRFEGMNVFTDQVKLVIPREAASINSRIRLEMAVIHYTSPSGKPLTRILKECFDYNTVSVGFQKHSPLMPRFNKIIMAINESGLARHWFKETLRLYLHFRSKSEKNKEEFGNDSSEGTEGGIPLGLAHVQGIFIVWSLGLITSTMLFIAELRFGQ